MAASRIIEEETGTWSGLRHKHNGYYAGDFSDAPFRPLARPPHDEISASELARRRAASR